MSTARLTLSTAVLAGALLAQPALASFSAFDPAEAGNDFPPESNGRVTEVPSVKAHLLGDESITVDGKLDDPAWAEAEAACGFRVWDPDRGAIPSEETVFKVAYDEGSVYFGVACFEDDPSKVVSNLARRDRDSGSDIVSIYVDPYLDRTTGYNFRVNPRGVVLDAYMFNDGDRDDNWDAVWQAETSMDENGWYAEIRIPFSSIRYRPAPDMTWGLQVYRYMHGRGEDTAWVTWPRETRGFISRFGELTGLHDVPPPRQIEVLPYFLSSARDPDATGSADKVDSFQNFGADLKYGVTADLTLNATVNPDFGQVEADPATLNLSPFETFYDEKRPFFIEGSRFFEHPDFNLFYSRRIGTGNADSRIRLAAKMTGKTRDNVSMGFLAATTDVARGMHSDRVLDVGSNNVFEQGDQVSHYFVGRVGKEFDDANYKVALMGTAAIKTADRAAFGNRASREAYTTGLDFDLNFHDRDYNIQGSVVGSFVDPEELPGDPRSGKTVRGHGGALDVRRLGGNLQAGTYFRWESDKLDINDLGFLSAPDEIGTGAWASYRYNPEGESKLLNRANLNFNFWRSWLYGGREGRDLATDAVVWSYDPWHAQWIGGNVNGWMQFRNYMEAWWGIEDQPTGTRRYETRGGPLIDEPATTGFWWGGITDTRKDLKVSVEGNYYWDVKKNRSLYLGTGVDWNQSSAISHSVSVGYRNRFDDTQYLETVNLSQRPGGIGIGGLSYVFGDIHQQTVDVTLRSNLLFSRDVSIELYFQPFLTVGSYRRARELATPDSYDLVPYEEPGYDVRNNDFSYSAVNVNAVFRWEYRPGSTLFLVWTHSRNRFDNRGSHADSGDFDNRLTGGSLFRNEPENVFMAKLSYWFAL